MNEEGIAIFTNSIKSNTAERKSAQELMNRLERGKDETKIETMRDILTAMLNGDPMPQLLMHVIRFVMPSRNKELKKLLHFYWEICPKLQPNGQLKQEMILVCNAIRNDLQHPNEYIRGATLRFLCKLREPDLLEPLVPSIRTCLEHRHAYVRKNAVFTVYSIASHNETLIPDAVELIHEFLENETDATCKRNAFISLSSLNRDYAYAYFQKNYLQISNLDELLQLAFIDFLRKDAVAHPELKSGYLNVISEVLESPFQTVGYEAANALTALTNNPTAIQAGAKKYVELAIKESDNNIKLIVLDRVDQLRIKNPGVLNDLTMDVLYVLSSPDLDVRQKALSIALSMVSNKNVEDVVKLFKKELSKTLSQDYDKNSEYRQLLIHAIHTCAIRFVEVAAGVVDLLLDFLGDFNTNSAADVISFVKEVVEVFPNLRHSITDRLLQTLKTVHSGTVYRGALWILGEYCTSEQDIQKAWVQIRESLGKVPILAVEEEKLNGNADESSTTNEEVPHKGHAPKVLADGTYATENAFTSNGSAALDVKKNIPPLRALILDGNYFVASVLASTLTKWVLRYHKVASDASRKNAMRAHALLAMTSILRVGESDIVKQKIDEDSADRIYSCIKVLIDESNLDKNIEKAFLDDPRTAFRALVDAEKKKEDQITAEEKQKHAIQVDSPIKFRQFARLEANNPQETTTEDVLNSSKESESISSKLKRIVQLTGFSDPVYAEAYVNVHQFDIVLDVLLFNQTLETLQNLSVEFATLGDLKVVERPTTQNIGPQSFHSIQTTIKVSSADAGVIFGNIVYEGHTASVNNIVILNDLHVDVIDYIKPGHCTESEFRSMWSEFEWENKVNISVTWPSLQGFLRYLLKNTNMTCLTKGAIKETANGDEDLTDDCQFLSANLHARSTFGEDALANLSLEKDANGKITGHVRIRSKGQGLALSLGDRVADLQRRKV